MDNNAIVAEFERALDPRSGGMHPSTIRENAARIGVDL